MIVRNFSLQFAALPLALAVLLAAGCAPVGQNRPAGKSGDPAPRPAAGHGSEVPVWRLDELARDKQPVVLLRVPGGATMAFKTARAALIGDAAAKVAAAADMEETPDWLLAGTLSVNAFAAYRNGRPVIGVTLGMAHLLGDDEGAWGALIGHELAHFRLGHHEAQRSREQAVELGSSLAGVALSVFGLGFGSIAGDAAGTLMARSFSRDDERDADQEGIIYVRRAGLDARGALRLQEKLLTMKGESSFGFLSTHPGGQERIDRIRALLEKQDDH